MDKNKEQLKAEFVLDVSTLNKQLDIASRKLTESMKRATDNMAKVMAGNTAVWGGAGTKIGTAMGTSIAHSVTRALAGLGGSITRTVGRIASAPIRMITSPMGMIGGGLGAAGAVAGFGKVINAGRDLQSEQVQIQKTTNLTDAAIAHLTQRLIEFSNATGSSRSAMMGLAADAGRLGVRATEDLEKFATTFIKASTATNVGPDMAEEVLRVMNSIGEPVSRIDRIMSAVNELGNNLATNERRILEFVGVMPGLSNMMGFTTEQLLSFAAVASTTANEAGLVGTAMNNLGAAMLEASTKGGPALKILADTAGMSSEAFSALLKQSGYQAMVQFIAGMKRVKNEGGDLVKVFNDMGSEGSRLMRAVLALSNVSDKFSGELGRAAAELQQNTSLTDEFGKRLNTVEQQQHRVTESLRNFFATLNDNKLNTEIFKTLADALQNMIDENKVALAARFTGYIERLGRVAVSLPFYFEKARIVFNGMMTDPKYLEGIITALGNGLMDALSAAWLAFLGIIVATIDLIVKPITDAVLRAVATSVAKIPGLGTEAVSQAAAGYTGPQLQQAMSKGGLGKTLEDAAQAYALDEIHKRRNTTGESGTRIEKKFRDEFKATMTPQMFQTYVMPLLSGVLGADARVKFMGGLGKMNEDPAVRAQRDKEIYKQAESRTKLALDALHTSLHKSADKIRAAGEAVATAIAGKDTKTGRRLSEVDKRNEAAKNELDERIKAGRDAARNPLRRALESPIREEAQKRNVDFDSMSEERKRQIMTKYYNRNPFPTDVMSIAGADSQQGLKKILASKLREESYADRRAQLMQARGGGGTPWREGIERGLASRVEHIVKLSPESSVIQVDLLGAERVKFSVNLTETMHRSSTAAALSGSGPIL